MRNSIICILVLSTLQLSTFAQATKPFPEIRGTTLEDVAVSLPMDTKGKFTLLGLAYSKAAEAELVTWYQPVYTTFLEKNKPSLFNESYDVNLYFIPMFTGVNQAATGASTKKMKEGMDKQLHKNVLVYKGDLKPYKDKLDFEKKDTPYFFVLDKQGNIIHTVTGKYTDEKLAKIEELIGGE